MALNLKLLEAMDAKSLNARGLSRLTGLNAATISALIHCRTKPRRSIAIAISHALSLPPEEIFPPSTLPPPPAPPRRRRRAAAKP